MYDAQTKRKALRAARYGSVGPASVARTYSVGRSTLYRWLDADGLGATSEPANDERARDDERAPATTSAPALRRITDDEELLALIREIHARSKGIYGSPKIRAELRLAHGVAVGRRRVAALMRAAGIRGVYWEQKPEAKPIDYAPNVVNRQFDPLALNTVWGTDMTQIPSSEGWVYLAGEMDFCSRRVVGWSFADTATTDLARTTLRDAVRTRQLEDTQFETDGIQHHSDRGSPYSAIDFRADLSRHKMVESHSRTRKCRDNAPVESLWSRIKCEFFSWLASFGLNTRTMPRRMVESYLCEYLDWYNTERRHSHLGYLTPAEFEARLNGARGGRAAA